MIFLYIHIGIAIFSNILLCLAVKNAEHLFETRYPGVKITRSHWTVRVVTLIKVFFLTFCPIVNIICAVALLFDFDKLCEKTATSVYVGSKEE